MGDHSLTWLLDHTLPLNRKERFYTGTVLPGIVCADLSQLSRLTALMGRPDVVVSDDPEDAGLLFFTEYGIAESAYGSAAERFADFSTARDTPDVVFLTTRPAPVLFALEAKMYHRPGGALRAQLDLQRELLDPLAERLAIWLGVEDVPVVHCALLPEQQATALELDPYPVVTWQQVHDAYADAAPAYWLRMLSEALRRYDGLVSRAVANDADRMTGAAIVDGFLAGTLDFTAMGRSQGLAGQPLHTDIESGAWRTTQYQVAADHPGNRNWFAIEDFVSRVAPRRLTLEEAVADLHEAIAHADAVGLRVLGDGSVTEALASATPAAFDGLAVDDVALVAASFRAAGEALQIARAGAAEIHGHVGKHA